MVGHFDMCTMLTIAVVFICTTNVAATEKCYDGLGCFDTSLRCNRVLNLKLLPQKPSEIKTEFLLYTPENPKTEQVIDWNDDDSIINSNFQGTRDTKLFIHGYTDDAKRPVNQDMKDALLSKGNFNVILVSWKSGPKSTEISAEVQKISNLIGLVRIAMKVTIPRIVKEYLQARQNTRLVGRQIGELSRKLQKLKKASFSSMHLIGHSLGAHVAGFAGEHVSGQYGRITGLDPAGPWYEIYRSSKDCLLDKSDADFVDIIHTDGVFGIRGAVGHQDFYPSGGKHQVSCSLLDLPCDHLRAVDFFIESITTKCKWRAYPCESWGIFKFGLCARCGKGCSRMGYYADRSKAEGKFMLKTNKNKPYCKE